MACELSITLSINFLKGSHFNNLPHCYLWTTTRLKVSFAGSIGKWKQRLFLRSDDPSLFFFKGLFILCVWLFLPACLSVHVWWLWRPDEGIRSAETRVTDDCEPPHGFWELNPRPLKKQPMLLTTELYLRYQVPLLNSSLVHTVTQAMLQVSAV